MFYLDVTLKTHRRFFMAERIFNFSAGPAALPLEVLQEAQQDLVSYKGAGLSVMEMSHRSKEFSQIIDEAREDFRQVLNIPDDYAVLFLHGGASMQFAMAPMNFAIKGKPVDVIHTGSWTKKAISEIKKIAELRIAGSSEDQKFRRLPTAQEIDINPEASYVHMCSNNTIAGTQFKTIPETGDVPLIADMSSDIFSKPVDVKKFGMIFAGAQKNAGPAGVALAVVRKDLAERADSNLPTMLQYRTHIEADSLYNTPPAFSIYIVGLVLKWLKKQGGLEAMAKINEQKAGIVYEAIEKSSFYYCPVETADRSLMNVVFRITNDNEELEKKFIAEAKAAGLDGLKGHRSVGGLRASIYNAHPREGIEALVNFMSEFEKNNS